MSRKSKVVPTLLVNICTEMVDNAGEDSYSSFIQGNNGYIGVFDGCGGMGARRYEKADGHTGAYISSRACALSTFLWVSEGSCSIDCRQKDMCESLKKRLKKDLTDLKAFLEMPGERVIKGDLYRALPTTLSVIITDAAEHIVDAAYLWAGDSRGYLLDAQGLCQITEDDIDDLQDAYSNLTSDSRLENVVNADTDFQIHEKHIHLTRPSLLIAATDGAFAYMLTPMEFEYIVLHTMLGAMSPAQWESALNEAIGRFASDDYSLMVLSVGFENYGQMQTYFRKRESTIYAEYIEPMGSTIEDDGENNYEVYWKKYKKSYERYMT